MKENIITQKSLKLWPDNKLSKTFLDLNNLIYVADCFGTKDLILRAMIGKELIRRGFRIVDCPKVIKISANA